MSDKAPIVYDEDGNPLKVRIVGGDCEGDVSGEGHFAYRKRTADADHPTVYFEGMEE